MGTRTSENPRNVAIYQFSSTDFDLFLGYNLMRNRIEKTDQRTLTEAFSAELEFLCTQFRLSSADVFFNAGHLLIPECIQNIKHFRIRRSGRNTL